MTTNDDLLAEAETIGSETWFIQDVEIVDRTDATVTVRLFIDAHLFVQVFFSQRSWRQSLALIGPAGRIFGWDWEHGDWHSHPFGHSEEHEMMSDWAPARRLAQFMAAVEELLDIHGLV